jgi:hypothetical protein
MLFQALDAEELFAQQFFAVPWRSLRAEPKCPKKCFQ